MSVVPFTDPAFGVFFFLMVNTKIKRFVRNVAGNYTACARIFVTDVRVGVAVRVSDRSSSAGDGGNDNALSGVGT